jgi:hypothetical protein
MVTVITKTIGSGKDYASFTLAEADVENIGTSADLVANDEAIVFEADAGTYSESVTFQSTLTTDATRNVTYKPAAGSEHGGVFGAGVHFNGASTVLTVRDNNTALLNLSVYTTSNDGIYVYTADGVLVSGCMGSASNRPFFIEDSGSASNPIIIQNCVSMDRITNGFAFRLYCNAGDVHAGIYNCTALSATNAAYHNVGSGDLYLDLVNCLSLGTSAWVNIGGGALTLTGSNNFGGSTNPFPVATQGSPYPITASTAYDPGAGDFALYVGKNGALLDSPNNDVIDGGVGPSVNSDVPTTDILGNARSGATANPGAFEVPQATATLTRTIGPVGRDYATFTLAEADVDNIPTSTDLVNENEAIVFEADAATYAESVNFSSTLTTDATRNVTYKPAAGSEHGGVFGAGVVVSQVGSIPLTVADNYTVLDGLQITDNQFSALPTWTGRGVVCKNVLASLGESSSSWGLAMVSSNSSSEGATFINCNFRLGSAVCAIYARSFTSLGPTNFAAYNCSFTGNAASTALQLYASCIVVQTHDAGLDVTADVVNSLDITGGRAFNHVPTGSGLGVLTLTGSNNFGGSTNPFPVAIQGSPYPITATTDTDPGPGDWAIYDAATGALIDDPDNDVLAGGIGPDANPDVPTTDIVGNTRSGATTDPGAFEISTLTPPEPPGPELITIMRQIYQQDASFSIGASSAGVEKITHQLGPASADYFTINSTTSATVSVPRTAHALRVICVVAAKACDVTLDLDASNSVYLGSIGGVASVQTDLTYFWSFGQVVSDGTYPRVRIADDGFSGDQLVYLWWHLA